MIIITNLAKLRMPISIVKNTVDEWPIDRRLIIVFRNARFHITVLRLMITMSSMIIREAQTAKVIRRHFSFLIKRSFTGVDRTLPSSSRGNIS